MEGAHADRRKSQYLRIALYAIGALFLVGVAPLMMLWTAGFAWKPAQFACEQMIMGIYITLGLFLIMAARDPLANRSLIWLTVWSSVAHGSIMLVQALVDDAERMNLLGDVPALFVVAAVLGLLMPREPRGTCRSPSSTYLAALRGALLRAAPRRPSGRAGIHLTA